MSQGPKYFTCPKCRHKYLGHDPLPDCPGCGYDYREKEGFRWDVVVYLLTIVSLLSFLLVASHYRGSMGVEISNFGSPSLSRGDASEKLPGSESPGSRSFRTPYHESER